MLILSMYLVRYLEMLGGLLDELVDLPGVVHIGGEGQPSLPLQVHQIAVYLSQLKIYQDYTVQQFKGMAYWDL